jgi:hypothetical protein
MSYRPNAVLAKPPSSARPSLGTVPSALGVGGVDLATRVCERMPEMSEMPELHSSGCVRAKRMRGSEGARERENEQTRE